MKTNLTIIAALAIGAICSLGEQNASAQKKVLDHSVYDGWERVTGTALTRDGKVITYQVAEQEGDATLYFKNIATGQELVVPRGTAPKISKDSKWAVFQVKAPYAATRQAKIDKKKADQMPKDSLAYVNLTNFELKKIAEAKANKTGDDYFPYIAYTIEKPAALVILNIENGQTDTLKNVSQYTLNAAGNRMAVVTKKDKKDSLSTDGAYLYNLADMSKTTLSEGKKYYSLPSFSAMGNSLVFLASTDSSKSGSKLCSVFMYDEPVIKAAKGKNKAVVEPRVRELIAQGYNNGFPKGMGITEESRPSFNAAADAINISVATIKAPKDTTIIDFETARVDIWNWDAQQLPPTQKVRGTTFPTRQAIINLSDPNKILVLTKNEMERVSFIKDSDWGLASDRKPYYMDYWGDDNFSDYYFVNTKDGSRKEFKKQFGSSLGASPAGKYLTYFNSDDCAWYCYNIATGATVNLTAQTGVNFYDEDDDHPTKKSSYGSPVWMAGDEALLIYDKYDIWKFTPDGKKAENLTMGEGRKNKIQFRYTDIAQHDLKPGERYNPGKKDVIYVKTFNEQNKENGYGTMRLNAPNVPEYFTEKHSFSSVVKAQDTNVIAYIRGNLNEGNNQFYTLDGFKSQNQLSFSNPQQAEYNWANVQLVEWKAYDGTKLQGLLYTPENLDKSKKYPMMIYFYEKNSETLYNYIQPAPSRSTVNLVFYASRGYVVFVPDIVYTDGHPGESAYNCICAGAEAMCDQFSFIDKNRMAIQGQSWGGYQTAYLVTRTNMFAAAGAGAPVGNMTSAYGGIRWESGNSRASQYEHGQSRIGKSLWDEGGLELYIENSPVFHANKVTTPTLIMHNDADGAVPWYQGIEFFMSLKRWQKPAWLLEYNDEAHNLVERRNCKDLSIRLQQFFDHYLKGEPMPAWMKTGVPTSLKGQYFGFEPAED